MLRSHLIQLHILIHSLSHRHTLIFFIFSLIVLAAHRLMDFISSIFGILGNVTSFIMFLLPARSIYKVQPLQPGNSMERIASNVQRMLYHAAIISHFLWVVYADVKSDLFLRIANTMGTATEIFFSVLFILFTRSFPDMVKHGFTIVAVLVPLYALGDLTFGMGDPELFAGAICATVSVLLCVMKYGYKPERVPYLESVVSFTNAVIWTLYAFISVDKFLLIPNLVWTFRWLLELVDHSINYRPPQPPTAAVEMASVSRTEPTEPAEPESET